MYIFLYFKASEHFILFFTTVCHCTMTFHTGSKGLVWKIFFLAKVHLQTRCMGDSLNHWNKTDLRSWINYLYLCWNFLSSPFLHLLNHQYCAWTTEVNRTRWIPSNAPIHFLFQLHLHYQVSFLKLFSSFWQRMVLQHKQAYIT